MSDKQLKQAEALAADNTFCQWVLSGGKNYSSAWENYLEQSPAHRETVQEARYLVLSLQVREKPLSPGFIDREWKELEKNLDFQSRTTTKPVPRPAFRKLLSIAATLLLLAVISYLVYPDIVYIKYKTAYGQQEQITLPDGTEVVLNGNSTLKTARFWNDNNIRRVWLDGEGYFDVNHQPEIGSRQFIVHTDGLDVEVLGTSFNVNTHRDRTEVVLTSGKVRVRFNDGGSDKILEEPGKKPVAVSAATLAPGQKINYLPKEKKLIKLPAKPHHASAWKEGRLVFEKTPLGKIALTLEDTYGLKVIIENNDLAGKMLTGTVPADDLEALLEALELLFNLEITREGNRLVMREKM